MGQKEKTTKDYWNEVWLIENKENNKDDTNTSRLKLYFKNYQSNKIYNEIFSILKIIPRNSKLLELGCANSSWLPIFALKFGFDIDGVDYSENGCRLTEKLLIDKGISNFNIYSYDFFNCPASMKNRYDVVVSFGVIEHFNDVKSIVELFSSFLKKGGILITEIPNMKSFYGPIQKFFNTEIYEGHNPLELKDLEDSYLDNNLKILKSSYLFNLNLNILNIGNTKGYKKMLFFILTNRLSTIFYILIDSILSYLRIKNKYLSSYILIIGQK